MEAKHDVAKLYKLFVKFFCGLYKTIILQSTVLNEDGWGFDVEANS
jgi:hypothetical protein